MMEVGKYKKVNRNKKWRNKKEKLKESFKLITDISYDSKQKSFDFYKLKRDLEGQKKKMNLKNLLQFQLQKKYSSSQNFYYTKEIDNILCNVKSRFQIIYNDQVFESQELEKKEEMLKRYYKNGEYSKKIHLLSEYYKFHEDVPRLAMLPLSNIIHSYHDQKRRLNYIKITKMLNNGQIDSELVRNMDPNEESDISKGSIASSLLYFLPDELKNLNEWSNEYSINSKSYQKQFQKYSHRNKKNIYKNKNYSNKRIENNNNYILPKDDSSISKFYVGKIKNKSNNRQSIIQKIC